MTLRDITTLNFAFTTLDFAFNTLNFPSPPLISLHNPQIPSQTLNFAFTNLDYGFTTRNFALTTLKILDHPRFCLQYPQIPSPPSILHSPPLNSSTTLDLAFTILEFLHNPQFFLHPPWSLHTVLVRKKLSPSGRKAHPYSTLSIDHVIVSLKCVLIVFEFIYHMNRINRITYPHSLLSVIFETTTTTTTTTRCPMDIWRTFKNSVH